MIVDIKIERKTARLKMIESSCSVPSDTSENGDEGAADDICRDFLRNVCKRGSYCRYRHLDIAVTKRADLLNRELIFCHDFQNAGCRRANCRFVHCTREEQEHFQNTRLLPAHTHVNDSELLSSTSDEPPICKDFLKGECHRGAKCKYEHLNEEEIAQKSAMVSAVESYKNHFVNEVAVKKRKLIDVYATGQTWVASYKFLEDENQALRHEVDELKRNIAVLVAANELLLEQNARYRSCKLITVPPIVAVSQMLTPTITPAPTASRPGLPHPHGITTMATLSHVTINGNRELVVSQPCIASPPTHIVQHVSLAQPPTSSVDQSVSMAINMPPHTIVPMTITVDAIPQNITALNMPQTSHLMSNSTLVSYPIMSHAHLPSSSLG